MKKKEIIKTILNNLKKIEEGSIIDCYNDVSCDECNKKLKICKNMNTLTSVEVQQSRLFLENKLKELESKKKKKISSKLVEDLIDYIGEDCRNNILKIIKNNDYRIYE